MPGLWRMMPVRAERSDGTATLTPLSPDVLDPPWLPAES